MCITAVKLTTVAYSYRFSLDGGKTHWMNVAASINFAVTCHQLQKHLFKMMKMEACMKQEISQSGLLV
jgi:hypothetical protein